MLKVRSLALAQSVLRLWSNCTAAPQMLKAVSFIHKRCVYMPVKLGESIYLSPHTAMTSKTTTALPSASPDADRVRVYNIPTHAISNYSFAGRQRRERVAMMLDEALALTSEFNVAALQQKRSRRRPAPSALGAGDSPE
jgi:hypothetical protein